MQIDKYFTSLTAELLSLKDRVRFYIDDAHWLSDGEWKESVMRSMLRRHLPATIGVGRGFIITPSSASTQIDILLYDKTKPILFQDGDFILITPDAVKGVIEVKTRIRKSDFKAVLNRLVNISKLAPSGLNDRKFFGIFSYEDDNSFTTRHILECLRTVFQIKGNGTIHCISLGASRFIRFWDIQCHNPVSITHKWHAYNLENKAPAYLIHNVIEFLNPEWAGTNQDIWYPRSTKEPYKIDEITIEYSE